jgi:hypothetical protein
MAELEIHHETEGGHDPAGTRIGVLSAVLAVLLAITTIASHRAHTAAIISRTEANDLWAYYQARRIKLHNLELGQDLLAAAPVRTPAAAETLTRYGSEIKKYEQESRKTQEEAGGKQSEAGADERRALHYDFGEGLLEIALVLTSLYFISRKRMFPVIGVVAGIAGVVFAIVGVFG